MNIDQSATIDKIELYEVSIPLKTPFQISGGTMYDRKSLIIKVRDGKYTGYGESAPFEGPFYSEETLSTVRAVLTENIFPKVIGRDVNSIEDFNLLINHNIRGNSFAKAGLETAYWDLIAKKNNISIQELIFRKLTELGVPEKYLKRNDYIESGVSIGIPGNLELGVLKEQVLTRIREGYRRIKIKIKPGWDIEPVKMVREAIGNDFPFWVDANSAYSFPEHLEIFKEIDDYNCLFIEQPLNHNDIIEHTKLSREIETPICLDESLKDLQTARQIVELDTSKIWNIKIQRVGGLLEACKLYKIAVENNVRLWGGTMPESGVGAMFILALASFNGFYFPSDVEESSRWFKDGHDLIKISMDSSGKIYLNKSIGIGKVDKKLLKEYGEIIIEFSDEPKKVNLV